MSEIAIDPVRRRELLGIALVLSTAAMFGFAPTFARLAYDAGADVVTVLLARFVFVWLMLEAIARLRGAAPLEGRARRDAIGVGLLMGLVSFGYMGAIRYIPVGLASLTFYTFPLLIGLAGWLARTEHMSPLRWAALAVAFLGLGLALGIADELGIAGQDPRGLALALLAAVAVAISALWSRGPLAAADPFVSTARMMLAATAAYALLALWHGQLALPATGLGWVGFTGNAVCYLIGLVGFFGAIPMIGAARVGLYSNIEPLVSILFAMMILDERLSGIQALGCLLVGAALLLVSIPKR
jgi:drug/metabolite transporter (DMT)-like permease